MKRLLLLAALLLPACAPAPAAAPAGRLTVAPAIAAPQAAPAAAAPVKVVARVGLHDQAGRRLMADLTPWAAGDVDRVTLTVMKAGAEALAPLVLEGDRITGEVEFIPLQGGTTYDVIGRAYRAVTADDVTTYEAIDGYEADAASCTTTFTTDADGVTVLSTPLRITFGSRVFAGAGDAAVVIGAGSVTNASTTPDIDVDAL